MVSCIDFALPCKIIALLLYVTGVICLQIVGRECVITSSSTYSYVNCSFKEMKLFPNWSNELALMGQFSVFIWAVLVVVLLSISILISLVKPTMKITVYIISGFSILISVALMAMEFYYAFGYTLGKKYKSGSEETTKFYYYEFWILAAISFLLAAICLVVEFIISICAGSNAGSRSRRQIVKSQKANSPETSQKS